MVISFSARHFHKHLVVVPTVWLILARIVEALIFLLIIGDEDVAVMNTATLKDLKLAVKKKVNEMEESKMGHRQISW